MNLNSGHNLIIRRKSGSSAPLGGIFMVCGWMVLLLKGQRVSERDGGSSASHHSSASDRHQTFSAIASITSPQSLRVGQKLL
ncbi:hypothetical protein BDV98DRAFT_379810 [Pterulicium gracile]|uniref:Uncharacterized protein n=1 Tax=Pterulicium gracile TaxID=1884261 RepID=A0A5C3QSL0_9AGAR|nr:hypothetical protein BDV98DRAFT_379810 [Pterula gracilis]